MKDIIKNFICYFVGHKVIYNDKGCDVCGRCGKHEFYNKDYHDGKPFLKLYKWLRYRFIMLKSWCKIKFLNELPF